MFKFRRKQTSDKTCGLLRFACCKSPTLVLRSAQTELHQASYIATFGAASFCQGIAEAFAFAKTEVRVEACLWKFPNSLIHSTLVVLAVLSN